MQSTAAATDSIDFWLRSWCLLCFAEVVDCVYEGRRHSPNGDARLIGQLLCVGRTHGVAVVGSSKGGGGYLNPDPRSASNGGWGGSTTSDIRMSIHWSCASQRGGGGRGRGGGGGFSAGRPASHPAGHQASHPASHHCFVHACLPQDLKMIEASRVCLVQHSKYEPLFACAIHAVHSLRRGIALWMPLWHMHGTLCILSVFQGRASQPASQGGGGGGGGGGGVSKASQPPSRG